MLGTQFTIYDGGEPSKTRQGLLGDKAIGRQEIAGVLYDTNVLGFKGPRRMTGGENFKSYIIISNSGLKPSQVNSKAIPCQLFLRIFLQWIRDC